MKKLVFMACILCSGINLMAQDNKVEANEKEVFIIDMYLCSESEQLSWQEGLKTKLSDYGIVFGDEIKTDDNECVVVQTTCSTIAECDDIIAMLDGKKVKIRSGMHSDDIDDLFRSVSIKVGLRNNIKVLQAIDTVTKKVIYTRSLHRTNPLVYSGNAVIKTAINPQLVTLYKTKTNIRKRSELIREVLDRMSISISVRKRS